MTPEQQSEMRKREDRKGYMTSCAMNAMVQIIQINPHMRPDELAKDAWDIAQSMAEQRQARDCEPMI